MIRREVRRARKQYRCDSAIAARCRRILPGDRYYLSVASPNHDDLGNESWWPLRSCRACAKVYGVTWDEPVEESYRWCPSCDGWGRDLSGGVCGDCGGRGVLDREVTEQP